VKVTIEIRVLLLIKISVEFKQFIKGISFLFIGA
jgi:hypothetical protein